MTPRALLLCGALAGPVFVVLFTLIGAIRPDYDWQRHPVSSLALTGWGWLQTVNFLVTGALLLAFAIGLWRTVRRPAKGKGTVLGPLLVGVMGIGLIGAGLFATDPLSGYPPGAPDRIQYTTIGVLHDVFSMFFFGGLALACLAFAAWFARRRAWGWATYCIVTVPAFFAAFVAAGLGFEQVPSFVEVAGAMQRLCLAIGFLWVTLLALHVRGRLG